MKRLLQICFLSLIFLVPLLAQGNLTPAELYQRNIDEYGMSGEAITNFSDFSPDSSTWSSFPDAPEPFGRSIGGKIGDFVYVFGGQANPSMAAAYQISTNTWVASTIPTAPAFNPAFCVANGELYKMSGSGAVSVFEKFTPDGSGTGTWTVLTGGPTVVMNAQNAIAWDGGDYIYAHSSSYSSPYPSYLARYSISGNSWTNLTPTTLGKRYPGLEFLNGYLYLIGGLVPTGYDPTACAKYDPNTDTWSPIASLPEAVNFCKWSATQVPDYVVLVGSGGGYSTNPANTKIFYYDPQSDTWTYDSDTPAERGLALGFFMPGLAELFFGGGNAGGSSTNYQMNCWGGEASFIPVELTSFTASASLDNVVLNWATSTETNNRGFEIQRSQMLNVKGQMNWEKIGYVAGFGTTTEPKSYSFTDNDLTSGTYSYRLKQIDLDGSYEYSNIVEVQVNVPLQFSLSQNYPNPFNPTTQIKYSIPEDGFVTLKVYNTIGQQVAELVNGIVKAGNHEVTFNAASGLSSGVYYYRMESGNYVSVKKLILIK
jgi:hypothetical protein